MGAGGAAVKGGARHIIARLVEQAGVRRAVWSVKLTARNALRDAGKTVTKDALRRGEARAPKEILDDLEKRVVGRLSGADRQAIKDYADRAAEASKDISKRVRNIGGDRLAGFDKRLKSEGSLSRKVAQAMIDDPTLTVHEALADIKDSVRYTMELPHGDYARQAEDAMARMKASGFEPVGALKNTWGKESGYRGINSVWRDTASGQLFEMQFHSEASLTAKEATHNIYDFQRLPGLDPSVKGTLGDLQDKVFSKVPTPPGAADVGWPG